MEVLDKNGLQYFWGKAKEYVDNNTGASITNATAGSTSQSSGNTVTPITFHKSDGSSTTVNVQAKNGINGQDGTSVSVIEATSESNAISLSQQNPNNIYYWSEE